MASAKALLENVCNHPDDLESRSIYADFLMDQGDPRGDFIANQIQLSKMKGTEKDYPSLFASALRNEAANKSEWLKKVRSLIKVDPKDYGRIEIDSSQNAKFQNGFLHSIAIEPEQIEKQWAKVRKLEPVAGAEVLVMEALPEDMDPPSVTNCWKYIKLGAEGWVTNYTVSRLLNWDLQDLETLDLSGCDMGIDGAKLLVGEDVDLGDFFEAFVQPKPLTKKVKQLFLKNTNLGNDGLQTIFSYKPLQGLTHLDISQCRAGNDEALESLQQLKKLTHLSIAGNDFDLNRLAGWPVLKKLVSLHLQQTTTPDMFEAMFPTASSKLTELNLSSAKALLEQPELIASAAKKFVTLNIGSTSVGDGNFDALLQQKSVQSVVHLAANKCSLSDAAISKLIESNLKRLVSLDVSSNKLTDAAIIELADSGMLNNVVSLRTRNNRKLSNAAYEALIAQDDFQPASLDVGKIKDKKMEKKLLSRFGDVCVVSK